MKTIIFNGSPRKNGDTIYLINKLTKNLKDNVKIVSSYYDNINPCIDCKHCFKHPSCSIKDYMTDVYKNIIKADNIIIASPIYFSQPTGSLLNMLSRLQMFWAVKSSTGENLIKKNKKGAVILVGGSNNIFKSAFTTSSILLTQMNVEADTIQKLYANNTDKVKISDNINVINAINKLSVKLNLYK